MTRSIVMAAILFFAADASARPQFKEQVFEDTFALYALDAQMHHKFHRAAGFFSELYNQTSKKRYLYESIRMLEYADDTKALGKSIREALVKLPEDEMLRRFEVIVLLKEGSFAEASQKSLKLCEKSTKATDHLLHAEAHFKMSDYRGAYAALQKAYALDYADSTAERIALVQYAHLGEKSEAIKFLKQHIGAHGNSAVIGKRMGSFYADSGELDQAADMYRQTYEAFSDKSCGEEAVKIYLYQQDFPKATAFLEKTGLNDPLLLELYVRIKDFTKASQLALTLYERDNNPLYLAQSSVYRYEGSKNRNDPALLSNVVDGLKKATADLEEPLYLNYLGYLMIDHDLNVTEGMGYVRRAIEKQPDSPFYIDSLAWGHYKRGECAEALRLIKQVESMMGSDEKEVKDHLKAIEACKTKEK